LVEDFPLTRVAHTRIDIGSSNVGSFPSKPRNTVFAEVQLIAGLPGALVLSVEVGKERVGQVNTVAAITDVVSVTNLLDIALIVNVVKATVGALVGYDKRVPANAVRGCQAPNGVVFILAGAGELAVVIAFVNVEIKAQGL